MSDFLAGIELFGNYRYTSWISREQRNSRILNQLLIQGKVQRGFFGQDFQTPDRVRMTLPDCAILGNRHDGIKDVADWKHTSWPDSRSQALSAIGEFNILCPVFKMLRFRSLADVAAKMAEALEYWHKLCIIVAEGLFIQRE